MTDDFVIFVGTANTASLLRFRLAVLPEMIDGVVVLE
jgi:hypothetical protein